MSKPIVGISTGDMNGIGLEVIIKSLRHEKVTELLTPIIFGSAKVVAYHKNIVDRDFQFNSINQLEQAHPDRVNVYNCFREKLNIELGKPTPESGRYAFESLRAATAALANNEIDALVTGPINKAAMDATEFPFPGHTEYLTRELQAPESLMFMVSDTLRVGLVTNHLPLAEVARNVTKKAILRKLQLMETSLRMDFGIERPLIAVLALNPHAGDGGLIGDEDDRIVRPAVVEAKKGGSMVFGPFPADGFFGVAEYTKYDGILAMYHDQGLIPFKALSFGRGVNFTAGLRGIRTSPDHGTAYDLAGQNRAEHRSFQEALFLAKDITRRRKTYLEEHENPLRVSVKVKERETEEE